MKVLSKWALSLLLVHLIPINVHGEQPTTEHKSTTMIKGLCWSGASVICLAAACGLAVKGKGETIKLLFGHGGKSVLNALKNIFKRKRDSNRKQDFETIFEFLKITAGPICCLVVAYITALKAYEEFSHVYKHNKELEQQKKTAINT